MHVRGTSLRHSYLLNSKLICLVRLYPPGHACRKNELQPWPAWARGELVSAFNVLLLMGSQHSMVLQPFQDCRDQTMDDGGPAG